MRFITLIATPTILAPRQHRRSSSAIPAVWTPGTRESAPGVPVPGQTNVPDRLFAALAAQGGMAEMELGKLAQQKSRNDAVTAFAKRMVDDHGKSDAQLAELAKQAVLLLPTEPAPDQLEVKQRLWALNGTAFDVEYTRAQVTDHQKTVQLLLWVIASGENIDLQRFASGTLPDIVDH